MLRYVPPSEPAEFAACVKTARAKIAAIVASNKVPTSKEFDSKWGDFKQCFSKLQHGKCGYCEAFVRPNQWGDVEHFRPKASVTRLDPNLSLPWLSEDAPIELPACSSGYWWLAYEWSNYLFACGTCNQEWKRNLFPVAGTQPTTLARGCEKSGETPLLLNPFGGVAPEQHLEFDVHGHVFAKDASAYGEATITTCGLHRAGLVSLRATIAVRVNGLLHVISNKGTTPNTHVHITDLKAFGERDQPFAGMVRMLVDAQLPGLVSALWPDHF